MSILLEVKNLRTHLGVGNRVVQAVNDISFRIEQGETYCLVGESGSGKSITALSIMRLLPKAITHHPSGSILYHDPRARVGSTPLDLLQADEATLRQIRGARIAMIFQDPMTSLNPVFTVGDQLIEALQLHKPSLTYKQANERAIASLAQVQISNPEQRAKEYPHRLSGGQRQRVMIAMAMACEPDLLIADEPTTALDVTVQAEILRLMRRLQDRRRMSMLFITHDFGVVAKMAHQLGVMRLGKIVENGPVKEVLRHPQHTYTRQLLAALPENLSHASKLVESREAPSNEALLRIENFQVHFPVKKGLLRSTIDYVRAVDGVNLTLHEGEILALVGESGCGKTTLGRAVLRLIEPTGGAAYFSGRNLVKLSREELRHCRREMQIIFQDPLSSLNPRLTIAQTLTEPMAAHRIGANTDERLELARDLLKQVRLDPEYLWRFPHEFSGGQRQRIGIARALALNPRLIVCDEITSALDVSVQAEILQVLLQLRAQRNLTLLFITHNIAVVEYLSDRIAVMHNGKIVEHGATAEICRNPQQEYTKKLLQAVPRLQDEFRVQ